MSNSNIGLVDRFRALVHDRGPAAAIRELGTEDFVWWASGHGEIQDHIDQAMAIMRANYDERGMSWRVTGCTADADRVALEAECNVTLKDGRTYANQFHLLYVIRDNRVAMLKEYHNTAHANEIWQDILVPNQGNG